MRKLVLAGIAAMAACGGAHAAEVVDQSQPVVDLTRGFIGVGGDVEQKLAQTFEAGLDGELVALRLPVVGCGRGDLVIEIRVAGPDGGPDGPLLNTTRIDPALAPPGGGALHEFRLSAPAPVRAGADYAFTLRMDPLRASCSFAHSPDGADLYSGGAFFFESTSNPPGWIAGEGPGGQFDLAFQTVVETGPRPVARADRNCLIPGAPGGGLPIPESLPVCKCLRDGGLREFRCAFLHPDFFAIRRIPWPVDLGHPYTETWEVLPLTKLVAPLGVRLEGGNLPQPVDLSFKGLSRKSVQSRSVTLTAPDKALDVAGRAILTYGPEKWTLDRSLATGAWVAGPAGDSAKPN